jgi:hypothetical protein
MLWYESISCLLGAMDLGTFEAALWCLAACEAPVVYGTPEAGHWPITPRAGVAGRARGPTLRCPLRRGALGGETARRPRSSPAATGERPTATRSPVGNVENATAKAEQ